MRARSKYLIGHCLSVVLVNNSLCPYVLKNAWKRRNNKKNINDVWLSINDSISPPQKELTIYFYLALMIRDMPLNFNWFSRGTSLYLWLHYIFRAKLIFWHFLLDNNLLKSNPFDYNYKYAQCNKIRYINKLILIYVALFKRKSKKRQKPE